MGLNKSIENSQGVESSYHRISQIIRDRDNNLKVVVDSYKDKDARDDSKDCMSQCVCEISKDDVDLDEALLPQLYNELKLTVKFSGASDE
jgi:hypothetical protein